MSGKRQIKFLLSTIFVAIVLMFGISAHVVENSENERNFLIDKINNNEIAELSKLNKQEIEFELTQNEREWGFSLITYNPHSEIVHSTILKKDEMFESVNTYKK